MAGRARDDGHTMVRPRSAGLSRAWAGPVMAAVVAAGGVALAAWAWHLTRARTGAARWMAPASTAACFTWLTWVTATGMSRAALGAWFAGGLVGALAWSKWLH